MGGATTSGVVCAGGAVCGANQPNCGHEFAIIALAASPYDCKAKVVPTPMKHAMRKRARARKALLPSDGRIGPTDEWAIASRPGGATKRRADYLFPGRRAGSRHPMGVRQMNRLLKFWIAEAGLDPKKYGNESLRRTKALHILKGTGDLEMVRMLLGHAKIESTARFLRVPTTSDPISISRAFAI